MRRFGLLLLWGCLFPAALRAAEGKWTPEQILESDPKALAGMGLELAPEALWDGRGGGLLAATVAVNACSGGFISAAGLLVTNFHCAFPILQQESTPERDLITRGFLADDLEHELPGTGVRVSVPIRRTDVTAAVEGAVPPGASDLVRYRSIERRRGELAAGCEKAHPEATCEVAAFDDGLFYMLLESMPFPDVRLVYSPAAAIGDFGGDADNWSWPRHAGDLALLRVWAGPDGKPARRGPGNVPWRPPQFFRLSPKGIRPGDFVMTPGFPGFSARTTTAAELAISEELFFPHRAAILGAWAALMDQAASRDAVARLALADRLRRLENFAKSARGQIDGLRRGRLLERKREQERKILAWAATRPDQRQAVAALQELTARVARRRETWERDFLLEQMRLGAKPLDLALTLVRRAREQDKPDLERETLYRERNRDRLEEQLRGDQKRLHPPTEEALLADLLCRFGSLPGPSRLPAVENRLAQGRDTSACRATAGGLLAGTRVTDLAARMLMARESAAQLRARHDPLLDLAFALDLQLLSGREEAESWAGTVSRLRPQYLRAALAYAGRPVAPDANGTLRLASGQVRGYRPRDAVWMEPQTTLAGLLARDTGQAPFVVPEELRAAAGAAPGSRFADPGLHDVPVCFLADSDTGGGSSGSPVLDGRGELVGVNFDRVWENIANDYGYNPDLARHVSVDIRYTLWLLAALGGEAARPLLHEMGVTP